MCVCVCVGCIGVCLACVLSVCGKCPYVLVCVCVNGCSCTDYVFAFFLSVANCLHLLWFFAIAVITVVIISSSISIMNQTLWQ